MLQLCNFYFQKQVKKSTFLLEEKGVFSTFFAKVRYLPYNDEKCAKNTLFFKQKSANFYTRDTKKSFFAMRGMVATKLPFTKYVF